MSPRVPQGFRPRQRLGFVWRRPNGRKVAAAKLRNVWYHAFTVVLVWLVPIAFSSPSLQLKASGFILTALYGLMAFQEGKSSSIVVTPLSYYFTFQAIGSGLSAIYIGSLVVRENQLMLSTAAVDGADIATAVRYYVLGAFCLHVGIGVTRPTSETSPAVDAPARLDLVLAMFLFGVAMTYLDYLLVPFGAAAGIAKFLPLAAMMGFCSRISLGNRVRSVQVWHWTIVIVGTLALCVLNIRTGSKFYLMTSFYPLVWTIIVAPRLRPWILPVVVALSVFYLLFVAPVIGAMRWGTGAERESYTERFIQVYTSDFRKELMARGLNDVLEGGEELLYRQFDAAPLGFWIGQSRMFGFEYGKSFAYLGYAFIPRVLWRDKPDVTRGRWFTVYLGFAESEETATTSTAVTAIGELYWNFGLLGIIFGMFLIGCLKGLLWRLCGPDPRHDLLRLWLYLFLTLTMTDMGEAGTVAVSFVVAYVLFSVLLKLRSTLAGRLTPSNPGKPQVIA